MNVAAEKAWLRRHVRERLKGLDAADRRAGGERVAAHLRDRVVEAAAGGGIVALFASLPWEIDTLPLDELCRARGVARAYPVVEPGGLVFRLIPDGLPPSALARGVLGIPCPGPEHEEVALSSCALVVVPGLAFDRAGRRLGQGKGYYDRALAEAAAVGPPPFLVGALLDVQRVDRVPVDAHDVALPFTVSPAEGLLDHRRSAC